MAPGKERSFAKAIATLASIAAILGTVIAAIALIPEFGQWLSPRSPSEPTRIAVITPTAEVGLSLTPTLAPTAVYVPPSISAGLVPTATQVPSPTLRSLPTPSLTGKIAFVSARDGNYEIYVVNADGTNTRNLTNNSARDDGPAYSHDGRLIAFESDRDGNVEIYIMNADGTNR